MITALTLIDFQSHEATELVLGRFTAIVGSSNSGKSAVLRALKGALRNDPADGRVRAGATKLSVTVATTDGSVTWEKGKGRNAYIVGDVEQAKPGSKITPEADEILRLAPINLVGQFDPPYLLMDSPSAVARELGELTNVTVLFNGIRAASTARKTHNGEAKTLGKELVEANDHLATFGDLQATQLGLTAKSTALDLAATAQQAADDVQLAIGRGTAHAAAVTDAAGVLTAGPDLDALDAVLNAAEIAAEHAANVTTAWQQGIVTVGHLNTSIKAANAAASAIYDLEVELSAIDVCPLCGAEEVGLVCA